MDEKEKLKFLKQMGFSVGSLNSKEEIKKKNRIDNQVDRSELLALARKFDVKPKQKKQENLQEFLESDDTN